MKVKLKYLFGIGLMTSVFTGAAQALPALQLGGNGDPGWSYVAGGDDTWYTSDSSFTLNAYANATAANGGNGDYAWEAAGTNKFAYLVFAAAPKTSDGSDAFDISVSNASLVTSGYGKPPIEDTNDLSPHGIYDTYFEIYEFQFDDVFGTINDTQPGQVGSGQGYSESFDIAVSSLAAGTSGIHMDLFTVIGDGKYTPTGSNDNRLVKTNAPYSHDAEYEFGQVCDNPQGCDPTSIPEPGTTALFGLGLLGLLAARRRLI